jgi:glycosyltransferase involved in cell wall biosynthesis
MPQAPSPRSPSLAELGSDASPRREGVGDGQAFHEVMTRNEGAPRPTEGERAPAPADTPGAAPLLSFVIPARDEAPLIAGTVAAACRAAVEVGVEHEIVVVDDGSTDGTGALAEGAGARVIRVELHNIGAVRNAGARAARGDVLFFLDADTSVPATTVRAALGALRQGAIGGGAAVRFDGRLSWCQWALATTFVFGWQRVCGWAAGCGFFARRDAFERVGGFDERYFAAEERVLSSALKRAGRFVILREPVITSSRKFRLFSTGYLLLVALRSLGTGRRRLMRREGLEFLYDAPREPPR